MEIVITENDNNVTVQVAGDIEISTMKQFKDAVYEAGNNVQKNVIIDFERVSYIDSSGIGVLLTLNKMQKNKELGMRIINCPESIKKILEISSLREILLP